MGCSTKKLGKIPYKLKLPPVGNKWTVFNSKTKPFVVKDCRHIVLGVATGDELNVEDQLIETCGGAYELFNVENNYMSLNLLVYGKHCLEVKGRCRI